MGNMIEICILTDYLHDYEKDPASLMRAINEGMYYSGPYAYDNLRGVKVLPYHHADCFSLVAAHENMLFDISPGALRKKDEAGWFKNAEFRLDVLERVAKNAAWNLKEYRKGLKELRKKYPRKKKRSK